MNPDLTIIYYTANEISTEFYKETRYQLELAAGDTKIISVSLKPLNRPNNIVVDTPRSHINIYRQALVGAKAATTKYIAMAEDDILYSPEHFKHIPQAGKFAYNIGFWMLFTWQENPLFTQKIGGRRNLFALICERELFIETLEERFAKWPDETKVDLSVWAEPGRYEKHLGLPERESYTFYTNPPNIMFSHEQALGFTNLGTRKKVGDIRAESIPYWGDADGIRRLYE